MRVTEKQLQAIVNRINEATKFILKTKSITEENI
jgi:hypothetical protein